MTLRLGFALAALAAAVTGPALATPCADEVSTLEKRLDSAGAAEVTGTTPPGGTTSSHSDKALATPPKLTQSEKDVKPTAAGVKEARQLVVQAREEDKAGKAEECRQTIMKAKEKAGALP